MTEDMVIFLGIKCSFCSLPKTSLFIRELPTAEMHICDKCYTDFTLEDAQRFLRHLSPLKYLQTLKEISDESIIHKRSNRVVQTARKKAPAKNK